MDSTPARRSETAPSRNLREALLQAQDNAPKCAKCGKTTLSVSLGNPTAGLRGTGRKGGVTYRQFDQVGDSCTCPGGPSVEKVCFWCEAKFPVLESIVKQAEKGGTDVDYCCPPCERIRDGAPEPPRFFINFLAYCPFCKIDVLPKNGACPNCDTEVL